MSTKPGERKRHLSVVPDLPDEPGEQNKPDGRRSIQGLLSLVDDDATPPPPGGMAGPPPGTTADDLRRHLVESGAPQPFIDHAATFGDDVDSLFLWLRDYGPVFSEQQWAADLLDHWTKFLEPGVAAIEAERFGAAFLAMYDDDSIGMIGHLIAEAARSLRPEAVALARALASVGPQQIRSTATDSAQSLIAKGVADVPWSADLGAGEWIAAEGFADPGRSEETLVLQLSIAGTPHSFNLLLDHRRGGGLKDAQLLTEVGQLHRQMEIRAAVSGLTLSPRTRTEAGDILSTALAAPIAAVDPDQLERVTALLPLLRSREHLIAGPDVPAVVVGSAVMAGAHLASTPATSIRRIGKVHRIKVTLDRTKPAIWRRLEVRSSTTLAQLHHIIQAAFGWSGVHQWVFETPRGKFGDLDPVQGFAEATHLTLAAAAPSVGAKFCYLYDLDDDWRHSIVVENISNAGDVEYPRCAGGRRASPPEGCGGALIYGAMLAAWSDPNSPTTRAVLQTIPIPAEDFDPVAFATGQVNKALQLLDH